MFTVKTSDGPTWYTCGSIVFSKNFEYIRSTIVIPHYKTITPCGADLLFDAPGDSIYFDGSKDSATIRWKTTKFWGKEDLVSIDFAELGRRAVRQILDWRNSQSFCEPTRFISRGSL